MSNDNKPTASPSADDLLKQAKKMQEELARSGAKTKASTKTSGEAALDQIGKLANDITFISSTIHKFKENYVVAREALLGLYDRVKPIVDFVSPPLKWFGRKYMDFWHKHAYTTDKETGERKISRSKAGTILSVTFMAAATVFPGAIGNVARSIANDTIVEPVYDATRMAIFYRGNEKLFLSDSKELDHTESVHSVRGCNHYPCKDGEDTRYFRVRPRLMNTFWTWAVKHEAFFIPDNVVGPVAPGATVQCDVTNYGSPRWRIAQWAQAYPDILDIKNCVPITNKFTGAVSLPEGATNAATVTSPVVKQAPAP